MVVDADTSVENVLRRIREEDYGCALVHRDGKLCGIFTERDVLNKVIGVEDAAQQPISALMTLDPISVCENDPVRNAILAMYRGGFRNVPIVDSQGKVVSCVRHKDIVHFLIEHFAQQVLNLPPDPENMPDAPDGG